MREYKDSVSVAASRLMMLAAQDIWGTCKIRDLGTWASGTGFPHSYQGHYDLPYLVCKVGDMNRLGNEIFINSTENTIDDEIAQAIKAKIHPPGTVIFPKIGGAIATNKRRILTQDTVIDNNVLGIIPNDSIDSEWLYHFLRSIDLTEYQSGTSVPSIKQSVIEKIPAPLLPKDVQVSIASFLSWVNKKEDDVSWENAPQLPLPLDEQRRTVVRIEELAAKIEEAQKLRRQAAEDADALFWQSLKRIFTPFSDKAVSIGDVFKVTTGSTPSRGNPLYWNGDIKWVSSGEVAFCRINDTFEKITELGLENSSTKLYPPNTVLIAMIGQGKTRGQCAILDCYATTNQNIAGIHVYETEHLPEYVYWWLFSRYYESRFEETGTAQPALSGHRVKQMPIYLPSPKEQRRIVARLDELQAQVDGLKKHQVRTAEELDALLPAVLDRAFRGQL